MVNLDQGSKTNADGINLLVSILVCYPEIGTVNFEPVDDSLKLTFVLRRIPTRDEYDIAADLIRRSILSYHSLEGLRNARINFEISRFDGLAFIHLVRDVDTLSRGEIALISGLMREKFGEILISDVNLTSLEDDMIIQEDFIDNMIGNMKLSHAAEKLIGIREDGRVMVFNK